MKNRHPRRAWGAPALATLAAALVLGTSLAAAPPAAPGERGPRGADVGGGPRAPVPVGLAAVRSLDAVTALAAQFGLPLPPEISAAGIEQQFPFIGRGGLATDRPIGAVFVASPDLKPGQVHVFVFPLKPGAAPLAALKRVGAEPMPGRADTVIVQGAALRRTADHLLFGPVPAAVASLQEDLIDDAFKDPASLARVSVNVKAIRAAVPRQYRQFVQMLEAGTKQGAARRARELLGPDADPEAARRIAEEGDAAYLAGGRAAIAALEKLERLSVALDQGDFGLRVGATVQPLAPAAARAAPRHGLPPECFVRFDAAFSVAGVLRPQADLLPRFMAQRDEAKGRALTEQEKKQLASWLARTIDLAFGGAATTVGAEMSGGKPVVYVVYHYDKPTDYAADLRRLIDEIKATAVRENARPPLGHSTYALGDLKVTRVRLSDTTAAAPQAYYMDCVQRGQEVFLTVSASELRFIDRLLAAKPQGNLQGLAGGWLDAGAAYDALARIPGSPVDLIPEKERNALAGLVRGHRLHFSASARGDAVTVDLTLPPGLVRSVPKLLEMVRGSENEAEKIAAKTDIAQIETALDAFEVDAGRFPSQAEGLNALTAQPAGVQVWRGPYVKRRVPADPWGRPYVYRFPGAHNPNGYDLFSVGPDGREGGGDDVTNWAQR